MADLKNSWMHDGREFGVCVCVHTLLLHIFVDVGLWDHLTVKQLGDRILG